MQIIKAYVDCGYIDGDGKAEAYFLYDDDATSQVICHDVELYANQFFEDHIYLANGYDFEEGWVSDEEEADYYDQCYWEYNEVSKDELLADYEEEGIFLEVYDNRQKEANTPWH